MVEGLACAGALRNIKMTYLARFCYRMNCASDDGIRWAAGDLEKSK